MFRSLSCCSAIAVQIPRTRLGGAQAIRATAVSRLRRWRSCAEALSASKCTHNQSITSYIKAAIDDATLWRLLGARSRHPCKCARDDYVVQLNAHQAAKIAEDAEEYVRHDGTLTYFFTEVELRALMERQGFVVDKVSYIEKDVVNRAQGVEMGRRWLQLVARKRELAPD